MFYSHMWLARMSGKQQSSQSRGTTEIMGESGTPPMQRSVSPVQIMRCRQGSGESDASAFILSKSNECFNASPVLTKPSFRRVFS